MHSRSLALGIVALCCSAGAALAQVDSNVAVTSFAQSRGNPCSSQGDVGCGGCYPAGIPQGSSAIADAENLLTEVNPEWQPIGPMIDTGGGVPLDSSLPPASLPVTVSGTVVLSKINEGGDFPGSHVTDDQNTFLNLDPASASRLATGNGSSPSCPGEGCSLLEMEREIGKYPLFAWAGEGDKVIATGRWIFDCGHPDAAPQGKCTNTGVSCIIDSPDCDNGGNTCTAPAPNFNYRAEMHPPQAIVVLRNKGVKKIPGSQADVYISADGGGAGDSCTVTHLASAFDVLFSKACFLNHCSITTGRSCKTNKDCPGGETCLDLDPSGRVANINASDVEFDMPLPPPPAGSSTIKDLKISTKTHKPKGGLMPKPIFTLPTTAALHVKVPMSTALPTGQMPNVFAARIATGWKHDTTALTRVRVTFTGITINNPLKSNFVSPPRQCFTNGGNGPIPNSACTTDAQCPATGTCTFSGKPCVNDSGCAKTDFCSTQTHCTGGIIPGWNLFAEVNGDWVHFDKLSTVGAVAPYAAPPYMVPSTPVPLKAAFKFDEYVPAGGSIHITTSGSSAGCLDIIYGTNLADDIARYGLSTGAACLLQFPHSIGALDVTQSGTDFSTISGPASCTGPDAKGILTCNATPTGGEGGTCTLSTTLLCTGDTDCDGTCSATQGQCGQNSDCRHCSNNVNKFCTTTTAAVDCGSGTCDANSGSETCNGAAGTCNVTGGAFTLHYTVQKK